MVRRRKRRRIDLRRTQCRFRRWKQLFLLSQWLSGRNQQCHLSLSTRVAAMAIKVLYRRRISSRFSDGIYGKRIPKECPNVHVCDERRCERRFDTNDQKVVVASLLSLWRSKRNKNTTAGLHVGLTESKAETMGIMYHTRSGKEKLVDSYTRISSLFRKIEKLGSEVMSQRRLLRERKALNCLTKISLSSDEISKEDTPKQGPTLRPRRKFTTGVKSNNEKVFSTSSCSQRSKIQPTSILRQPISNFLFDHCFGKIWTVSPESRRNQFAYLSCVWFFMYSLDHKRESVLSWIKKENIFSKRYVFVPILMWRHWSLLIFCHLGESLESKTTTPCMLLLDSLYECGSPTRLEPLIRRLVLDMFEKEGRPESRDMIEKIPLLVPKVPQQRDATSCGMYVLYYANLFLESAPKIFCVSNGYPYFLKEDWFTKEELEGFYNKLESLGLEPSDSTEGPESSTDSEGEIVERLVGDNWKPC